MLKTHGFQDQFCHDYIFFCHPILTRQSLLCHLDTSMIGLSSKFLGIRSLQKLFHSYNILIPNSSASLNVVWEKKKKKKNTTKVDLQSFLCFCLSALDMFFFHKYCNSSPWSLVYEIHDIAHKNRLQICFSLKYCNNLALSGQCSDISII